MQWYNIVINKRFCSFTDGRARCLKNMEEEKEEINEDPQDKNICEGCE